MPRTIKVTQLKIEYQLYILLWGRLARLHVYLQIMPCKSQKAVNAYLKSTNLLPFGFARWYNCPDLTDIDKITSYYKMLIPDRPRAGLMLQALSRHWATAGPTPMCRQVAGKSVHFHTQSFKPRRWRINCRPSNTKACDAGFNGKLTRGQLPAIKYSRLVNFTRHDLTVRYVC